MILNEQAEVRISLAISGSMAEKYKISKNPFGSQRKSCVS